MSSPSSDRTVHLPTRGAVVEESALDVEDASSLRMPASASQPTSQSRRPSGRVSFSALLQHRPSFVNRWRSGAMDEENGELASPKPERPPIPSALQPPPEVYSTPLPTLSMIVLSIVSQFNLSLYVTLQMYLSRDIDHAGRIPVGKRICPILTIHG